MLFPTRAQRYAVVCLAEAPMRVAVLFFGISSLLIGAAPSYGQSAATAGPNSDPTYQALRNLSLGSEAVSVNNLDLKRDAGTFHLRSGTVCFVPAVQGKVTGAVFVGDGNFVISPPPSEIGMLKLLTKENEFSENFSQMTLRFTDATYEEIKKAGGPATGGCDAGPLKDSQHVMRHKLKNNLDSRILEDVMNPAAGGLFVAFIHGKRYNGQELFTIDPHEGRDQVDFMTYDENKFGDWASFDMSGEHKRGRVGLPIRIDHHELDTTLEKNANLIGKSKTTFTAQLDGLRVVPFNLFRTLRVRSVTATDGTALSFIQEDKNDDAEFSVILPKALARDEQMTIIAQYEGKEAVINEGAGNYFPVARMNWYPNNPGGRLGEYAIYDMTFRIPKGMQIAVTGVRLSESEEGGHNVTVWKSEIPQTVAGFSFGKFKIEEAKLDKPEYQVRSFANQESPDWVQSLQHVAQNDTPSAGGGVLGGLHERPEVALGTMGTTSLNKKALAEGELAIQLYTDYFGPSSFKHLQITQQTACNFGQSWPELVWIPICYYFDSTVRHQLGMDWGNRGYWKAVTPHEVAHGGLRLLSRPVDERRIRRHVGIALLEHDREESRQVHHFLE